jgi:hypothetical protein
MTARVSGFSFAFDAPTDPDFQGVKVYASVYSGFTPSESNQVLNTAQPNRQTVRGTVQTSIQGLTHYLRFVPYDVFGDGTMSEELEVTPKVQPRGTGTIGQDEASGMIALFESISADDAFAPYTGTFSNATHVFAPNANHIIALATGGSGNFYLSAVDPADLSVDKVVDSGLNGSSWANLGVYNPRDGYCYFMINETGGSPSDPRIIGVDPKTLSIVSNTGIPGPLALEIRCFNPTDGKILLGATDGGSPGPAITLRTYDPATGTFSSAARLADGSSTISGAVYFPAANRYAVLSEGDAKTYFVTTDLASYSSYAHLSSPSSLRGICLCPVDNRVWVALSAGGSGRMDVLKPDFTLDVTIAAGVVLAAANPLFVAGNGLVIAMKNGDDEVLTFSPVEHTLVSSGVALDNVTQFVDQRIWIPSVQRFASRYRDDASAYRLGTFTI